MLSAAEQPSRKSPITATESVPFNYSSSDELASLFEAFRCMINDAIRIGVDAGPRSRFALIGLAYNRLKEYGLHTHYILSACEVAFSALRNKRRKSVPYVKRAFLKLDRQSYRLNHLLLRIPTTPKNYVFLALQGSEYHSSFIEDCTLKRGSVTINERTVAIAFTKVIEGFAPSGYIGVDVNERNVTVSATDGWGHRFTELREVAEIKERYRTIRASISKATRRDRRIGKRLLSKYGRRESDRSKQRVHNITKQIVDYAKDHGLGIKMEKLTGIRRLYRRGNGRGPSLRGRMNTWVFGETQRQVAYKAAWLGVPVYCVNPRGTSGNCPDCGSRVAPLAQRKLYCPKCDWTWDRDDLASKNVMACAVPQARPST
ncbi:MAG: transposase [Thaumarchaeota archaeon]|nr:transposase [Nitrososphaerota archaeon]